MNRVSVNDVLNHKESWLLWLSQRGAEVLTPTNEYEVIRFRTGRGTSVVYRKKAANSQVTFIGEAEAAWIQFRGAGLQSKWRAVPRTVRIASDSVEHDTLRKRDGDNCFYCDTYMRPGEATIEHLVALTHGGPQHISNKYLAHRICNQGAGILSAVEKIKIHTRAVVRNALREDLDDKRA